MNDLDKMTQDAFADGARYVLEYLRDEVYGDGVTETDVWQEFFGEED